jgi:23S rRNA pseudouridine1911/1915/1917 synthase
LIIIETPHWLTVNKPAGMIVERNPWEASVESVVLEYLHTQSNAKNPFLGIVHRLDRVTSGVLLMAKKRSALKELNRQFAERQVKKTYLAMVEKAPPAATGELIHWLVKDQLNKRALIFETPGENAVECRLVYRLLESVEKGRLLEIEPQTGKFHQIRAQLAAIGCPIVGDEKYGAAKPYRPKAIALHAWKLQFLDPVSRERVEVVAPPVW